MPIVELAKKIRKMRAGDELHLIADAIGAKEDVPVWCRRTGNELLSFKDENGLFSFFIRKKLT